MGIISLLVIGLLAGLIARLLMPGKDPIGIIGTLVLGVIGSFVGGFLGYVIFGKDINDGAFQASGLLGAVIGAFIVLAIYRVAQSRRGGRHLV